jgi:hypothetical protein
MVLSRPPSNPFLDNGFLWRGSRKILQDTDNNLFSENLRTISTLRHITTAAGKGDGGQTSPGSSFITEACREYHRALTTFKPRNLWVTLIVVLPNYEVYRDGARLRVDLMI